MPLTVCVSETSARCYSSEYICNLVNIVLKELRGRIEEDRSKVVESRESECNAMLAIKARCRARRTRFTTCRENDRDVYGTSSVFSPHKFDPNMPRGRVHGLWLELEQVDEVPTARRIQTECLLQRDLLHE